MKKVRIAMLLYVAVGLIPLAAFSFVVWPRVEKDYHLEHFNARMGAVEQQQRELARSQEVLNEFLHKEFSREFTEFQHWRAPLNIQSQAPSVVRSPLADPVSYTHLRAHETVLDLVCRLLLEKKHI